ncbi:MAG: sulfate adenylyltransferase, partial [Firmicutes bacterium ZCTH02-B6]
ARAREWPVLAVDRRTLSDVFCLATGVYSPLTGFMTRHDYWRVLDEMRLASGLVWSLPIVLPVSPEIAASWREGQWVALSDQWGEPIAALRVEDRFLRDPVDEARRVFGTVDPRHPGVARLLQEPRVLVGGEVWLLNRPVLCEVEAQCVLDPKLTRAAFAERGWRRVVGFQTRNPIHRAHEYILKCALEVVDGLLLHPLVGETKADDVPADVRLQSYRVLVDTYFPVERVLLAGFPAAMRYAGPREAVFHALCRKNYGCTHFIVGRDHAGVGNFYGTYDAQRIFERFAPGELGITPLFFEHAFYCRRCEGMATAHTCPHGPEARVTLSGTAVRDMLRRGEAPPPEFTRREVATVLMQAMGGALETQARRG